LNTSTEVKVKKEVELISLRKLSLDDDSTFISSKCLNTNKIYNELKYADTVFHKSENRYFQSTPKNKNRYSFNLLSTITPYELEENDKEINENLNFIKKKTINEKIIRKKFEEEAEEAYNCSTFKPLTSSASNSIKMKNLIDLKLNEKNNSWKQPPTKNKLSNFNVDSSDDDFSLMHSQSESLSGIRIGDYHVKKDNKDDKSMNSLRKCSSIYSKLEENYRRKSSYYTRVTPTQNEKKLVKISSLKV